MIATFLAAILAGSVPAATVSKPSPTGTTPPTIVAPVAPVPPLAGKPLGYLTADQLAERCKDKAAGAISYCFAYITGVHDSMRAYEIWLGQREFCLPVQISQSELRQSFLGYLSAYPTNRSGQAASVVAVALRETYPCTSGGASPRPR
ncbi:hypothetical protein BH10PSE13_BH10PSE13_04480 [soil metagenome]